ncbi:metallophosphoesterase [uncultured Pseudokineococcus sp.]|uniref:metallophosphoesterase n=1 Tax=uncultured Pseudokineococcus sp. TaxID=1642928 RepID=UPI002624FF03|nr:metallophosphoesterase [uncultured Pseudokineococcus sp.]
MTSSPLRTAALTTAALAGAGAAALAWGAGYEVRAPRLRRVEVPVLPPGAAPLRVLHLSDLHLTPEQRVVPRWVEGLADLEPDLVVDTGDNLSSPHAVPSVLRALDRLLDRPGVFVLGSNDRYEPKRVNPLGYLGGPSSVEPEREPLPTADLVDGFVRRGWVDLDNARTTLALGGLQVELVGVDDAHIGLDRYDEVRRPADPTADLSLGVLHAPYRRVLDPMARDGLDLLLAGHTHGGQLCVPFVGALVTNCDVPRSCASGLHRWRAGEGPVPAPSQGAPGATDETWLHVSAGLGTSRYARVRFACPPEATLLRLVARPA